MSRWKISDFISVNLKEMLESYQNSREFSMWIVKLTDKNRHHIHKQKCQYIKWISHFLSKQKLNSFCELYKNVSKNLGEENIQHV